MPAYSQASQEACYRDSAGVDLNAKNIISEARKNKAQITLEFLLVYSLVLIVFLIIFALIVAQRASTLASQEYSSMQLVAQTVSTAIDTALSSGSGYTATVQLPSAFGTTPYNLSISSTGVIIASMPVGKEVVSAQAFSNARSLVVNGTVVASGNGITLYKVPAYKGSVYIANSNGVIYIDQQPVSTLALARYLNVNVSFNGKVAQFNGQSSYISSSTANLPLGSSVGSASAWVYINAYPTSSNAVIEDYGVATTAEGRGLYITTTGNLCFTGWADDYCSSFIVPLNTWTSVGYVYTGGTNVVVYMNGLGNSGSVSTVLNTQSGLNLIGKRLDNAAPYISGEISNVQIYNIALSASQMQQLYQEGIGSAPISSAGLVGWWPLNGNANDYSGNGNQGTPYNVNFIGVAQINAHVTNSNGANATGDLVGFTSTSGNFSTSNKGNFAAYTNTNGIATAFLTGIGTAPTTANITVTAFNGNYTTIGNVVGWWPLNIGTGNTIYDLSTHYNNGAFTNPAWSQLANSTNFISAQFPGNLANTVSNSIENGFITINNTDIYTIPANRTFTVVAWIYYKGQTSGHSQGIFGDWPNPGPGFQLLGLGSNVLYVNGSSVSWPSGVSSFPKGGWEMITAEYTARTGMAMVYLNNSLFANQKLPTSLSLLQKTPYYIGDDAWQSNGLDTFNGSISNVQLYPTFLTSSQINTLYNEGINGVPLNNAGLVGWWPLNGNANDYSGNDNNGKINYNVSFINSNEKIQYAYSVAQFNGQSSYISGSTANLPLGSSAGSAFAWVYINAYPTSSNAVIEDYGVATTAEGRGIYITTTGNLCFTGWADDYCSSFTVPLNTWTSVGYVYTGGTNVVVYMNGLGNSGSVSTVLNTQSGLNLIGKRLDNAAPYISGEISDVQIYNIALSASQMQQLYQSWLPTYKHLTLSLG
jgi:uncharacterized protein (UPF0333 family)